MLVSETKNDRLCLLAEPVVLESCFGFGVEKLSLAFAGFRPVFAALRNTRRFTGAAPQIIELRTTDGALADDGNAVEVDRKSVLWGKSVSLRVGLGGGRRVKKKN